MLAVQDQWRFPLVEITHSKVMLKGLYCANITEVIEIATCYSQTHLLIMMVY